MTGNATVALALGRIFRMASRPTQDGDAVEYERCRAIVLNELESMNVRLGGAEPNYARDHNRGAAGD